MDKCENENCFGFVSFAKPGRLVYYNRTGNEFELDRYNTYSGLKRVAYKKNCGNEEQKKNDKKMISNIIVLYHQTNKEEKEHNTIYHQNCAAGERL